MFLILFLYFCFALTFILAKGVVSYIQPIFFVGLRMTLAGLILLGYQYWKDKKRFMIAKKDWITIIQVSIFAIFISYIGEFWSLQYVTASKVSLLFNLSPFFTAFFSYLFLSEGLTVRQWVALAVGFLGLIPILVSQTPAEQLTAHIGFLSMPEIMLLIAVASAAYGWVIVKSLGEKGYSSTTINGYSMIIGGLLSLGASFASEPLFNWFIPATNPQWGFSAQSYGLLMIVWYFGALIFLGNVVCYNLYAVLLRRYSATFLSFAGFTIPIFTALLDWMIFGYLVGQAFIISMAFVATGLWLFYQDERKQETNRPS